jgi:ribosomal protein L13E
MLLYITDGSEKELEGMKCHHYQTRTWCILDKSGTFNIVKWYPNDTIGVKPVNSITGLNNFCDKDSFREGKYPLDVLSTKKGAVIGVYSDMGRLVERDNKLWLSGNGKDGQQLFTKNLIDLSKSNSRHSFHFGDMPGLRELGVSKPGYELPKWRKLGIHVDMFFTTLKCSCGSEKGGFLFRGEKYLCQDCYKNNVFTCGSCGNEDYISKDKEIHTVVTTSGETIKLCDACWETRERHTCSCCGKYSKRNLLETDEGTRICPECLNNNSNGWSKCDTCGKISRAIRYVYNSFTKTSVKKCNSCKTTPEMQEISTFGRYFTLEEHRRTGGMSSNE